MSMINDVFFLPSAATADPATADAATTDAEHESRGPEPTGCHGTWRPAYAGGPDGADGTTNGTSRSNGAPGTNGTSRPNRSTTTKLYGRIQLARDHLACRLVVI